MKTSREFISSLDTGATDPIRAVGVGLVVFLCWSGLASTPAHGQEMQRNFAGSVQLDYLAIPTDDVGRKQALDGATVELSLKLAIDHSDNISSNIKICYACHGVELGMAYFDLRVADEFNVRIGRFIPSFGDFPVRHDPANHRTSDKPLPYDMGRMLRIRDWNMSVLPAPWVDNGIEISGSKFIGDSHIDYAVYAIGGPRGGNDAVDFDFIQSRSRAAYYVDNNSRPTVGARLGGTVDLTDSASLSLGASAMAGHYDPQNKLSFLIAGLDMVWRFDQFLLRAEYLYRRTQMSLGPDPGAKFRYGPGPDGEFDDYFAKHGFYIEAERRFGKLDVVARFDGMRRAGNVVNTSQLRSISTVLRSTAALSYRIHGPLRIKTSVEFYDFSDFDDEVAIHAGFAGPF